MGDGLDAGAWRIAARDHNRDGGRLFREIQNAFMGAGAFGASLEISVNGQCYRVRCDEASFTVYRVNCNQGLPPGSPGWTVCQVDPSGVYEEASAPGLGQCRMSCDIGLDGWLEAVRLSLLGRGEGPLG